MNTGEPIVDSCITDVTYMDMIIPGACAYNYTIQRTWIASFAGMSDSCIQTIMVQDTTRPMITFCPMDITLNCPGDTTPVNTGIAIATDNCDPAPMISYSDMVTSGGCAGAFTIERTWTASDSCGNDTTCVQMIVVQDTTRPVIVCPLDVTLDCPGDTTTVMTGMATATDACDMNLVIMYSDMVTPGGCAGAFTVTRTWTATDACGNDTTCVQTIVVQDTTRPVITFCPADITLDCPADTTTAATGIATATDACDANPLIAYSDMVTPGGCSGTFTITRTWTATDACGNDTMCVQMIVVQDTTAPVILSCAPDTVINCATPLDTTTLGVPLAIDECNGIFISYTETITPGDCPAEMTIERNWTVSDDCDNSSSCTQIIMVQDTIPPMFEAPDDISVGCEADILDLSLTGNLTMDEIDEACGIKSISFADDLSGVENCFGDGIIERVWTVIDSCDNMRFDTQHIQLITLTCLPCPDTVYVIPGETCLDSETYELGSVERVEVCDPGVNVQLITGTDSCVLLEVITPDFYGTDTSCVILCDTIFGIEQCDTTIIITVVGPPADATCIILDPHNMETGGSDTICITELLQFGTGYEGASFCRDATNLDEVFIEGDSCIEVAANLGFFGVDTICTVHCYDAFGFNICDTSTVITIVPPLPHTIYAIIRAGVTDTICVDSVLEWGTQADRVDFHPNVVNFEEAIVNDIGEAACLEITPNKDFGGIDTTCIVHCYSVAGKEVCDTTFIIVIVPPAVDTIIMPPGDTCLSNPIYELDCVDRVEILDQGDDVTLTVGLDSCILIEKNDPDFTEMDTVSVVLCKNIAGFEICDTTYIIVVTCIPLTCKSEINLSLDEDCNAFITPGMILMPKDFMDRFYTITITDEKGNPHPNRFDRSDVGKRYIVSVGFNSCPNSCWSTVLIEDKLPPQIFCRDTSLTCADFRDGWDGPVVLDNCDDIQPQLVGERIETLDCDPDYIKRIVQKYIATDASGNVSDTCYQEILLERLPLDEIRLPDMDVQIECSDMYLLDQNGNPHPSITGVPMLDGETIYPVNDFLCNITITYTDNELPKIGCTRKIMRVWEIKEWWCSMERTRPMAQMITIVDTQGPDITVPRYMEVTTGRRSCDVVTYLPPAVVSDACHEPVSVDISYPGGFLKDQNGGLARLPIGRNKITYIAYDACYNVTEDSMFVLVRDATAPVAVCEKHTVVALRDNSTAEVFAETLDDGSYDECGVDSFAIRRMDTPCGYPEDLDWGRSITVCCEDIGNVVMVSFRVVDHSGNEDICMVELEVQDKRPPSITCLPDITVNCTYHFDPANADIFGKIAASEDDRHEIILPGADPQFSGAPIDGLAIDNCDLEIREENPVIELNTCRTGTVTRNFVITSNSETYNCVQTITFENRDPFTEDSIVWPLDYEVLNTCSSLDLHPDSLPTGFGWPQLLGENECSQVGISYKDEVLPFTPNGDACLKILRNWSVIDWCNQQNGVYMRYTWPQTIKVNNDVAPELTVPSDTIVCTYDTECEAGFISLVASATDDCTDAADLFWRYEIDMGRDGVIDFRGNSPVASNNYEVGVYSIRWIVEDRCGNQDIGEMDFEIRNCKGPVTYCLNGVIAEINPVDKDNDGVPDGQEVELWASDFDGGSYHPCGYEVFLSFSPDTADKNRVYDCDSIGRNSVDIWVTDENGNTGRCITYVIITDTLDRNICTGMLPGASITGQITTRRGDEVAEAKVDLDRSGMPGYMTQNDGRYAFPDMPMGGNYTIRPFKNDDATNGVSTKDLVVIQRHILGAERITNPYDLIAADINKDGKISAKDLLDLRKLLLGTYTEFPNNTSCRFVDKTHVFDPMTDPVASVFPEQYEVDRLIGDMEVDFVGIKIGDVSGDVRSHEAGNPIQARNGEMEAFYTKDQSLSSGADISVPIYPADLTGVSGFQFTISFDPGRFNFRRIELSHEQLTEGHFGVKRLRDGLISVSWHQEHPGTSWRADLPVFQLNFTATTEGMLSEALAFTDDLIAAELYDEALGTKTLRLAYTSTEGEQGQGDFILYDNHSNPWNEWTRIRFEIPSAGEVALRIFDAQGKLLYYSSDPYSAGKQAIDLHREQLTGRGVLIFMLDYQNERRVGRMVLNE